MDYETRMYLSTFSIRQATLEGTLFFIALPTKLEIMAGLPAFWTPGFYRPYFNDSHVYLEKREIPHCTRAEILPAGLSLSLYSSDQLGLYAFLIPFRRVGLTSYVIGVTGFGRQKKSRDSFSSLPFLK